MKQEIDRLIHAEFLLTLEDDEISVYVDRIMQKRFQGSVIDEIADLSLYTDRFMVTEDDGEHPAYTKIYETVGEALNEVFINMNWDIIERISEIHAIRG